MKTSFSSGLLKIESYIVSKKIFMTIIFGHRNVLSPKYQSILYFDYCIRKWLKIYYIYFVVLGGC